MLIRPDDSFKESRRLPIDLFYILYVVNDLFFFRIKLAGSIFIKIGCCKLPILTVS